MVFGGIGMPMTLSPLTAAAMSAVPVDKAGVGSGVLNTSRQVGGALGVGIMGAIITSFVTPGKANPRFAEQFVHGLHVALFVCAGIAFIASASAALVVRTHASLRPEAEEAQPA
jgi:hypothetical protein